MVQGPRPRPTASPTSRRAMSLASRISTAACWFSVAISRRRSPTWRASRRRMRRRSATGTAQAEEITERIFLPERYSEPLPQAEREAMLNKSAIGRDFLAVCARQPFDVVKELFENEHVQLLFLFKVSLFGTWLVDTMSKTSPMGSVIRAFDLQSGYQLCQGGSFNLARGLMETFIAAGGRFQPQVDIEKIIVEGGKATRHRIARRPHCAGQAVRRVDARRASDLREPDRPRAASRGVRARRSTISNTPSGRCSACTSRSMNRSNSIPKSSIRTSRAR